MSLPALSKTKLRRLRKQKAKRIADAENFIILTLKNSVKLVVCSDSFHCIISTENKYKCILCNMFMSLNGNAKENHKNRQEHQHLMKTKPHLEEFTENLVRKIDDTNCYCTICNVLTSTQFIVRHVRTEEHVNELNKAITRAATYKPNE